MRNYADQKDKVPKLYESLNEAGLRASPRHHTLELRLGLYGPKTLNMD